MKYYLLLISIGFLVIGCSVGENKPGLSEPVYFPLKDYFEVQALQLDGKGVSKEITVNGEKEKIKKTLDSDGWLREFEFFIEADINSSSLAGSYETRRSEKAIIHELKPGEKGKIKRIVVNFDGEEVKDISFVSRTENLFYSSETRGVIYNQSLTGKLDNYVVETMQKVVFLKPNKMIITAAINYY
ncbi:hypothetical protein [Aquiflexum lacus]|uniref:hypothetical protein n=1 Tax=Aquiflexum lacus TaxID=2483805 RepID=UPI001892EC47|nr:hypothetical protein [Aquiflexum lacus]